MDTSRRPRIGVLLQEWRGRRRLSQLELSHLAETSARHLSYVETGRARPSRGMVLRLCAAMDVPLRDRNTMLLAADHAPEFRESSLDDAYMGSVRSALDTMLAAHDPLPAVVVDRLWNLVAANAGMAVLMEGIPGHLLEPRPNVFRLVLHPDGLTSRLANLAEVRTYFLERLLRQVNSTGDPELRALYDEVSGYPASTDQPDLASDDPAAQPGPVQVPLRIRTPHGVLSMFGTMATFGAPADVTLSELAIELFYPLDDFTRRAFGAPAEG